MSIINWLREGSMLGQRYQLCAPPKALRGTTGLHRGAGLGASLDFSAHRSYEQGDDLRLLDWNVYARSDKLMVKQYHEEVAPHLELLIDASASMDLAGSRKAEAAIKLAAMLVASAGQGHFSWQCRQIHDELIPVDCGHAAPELWSDIRFEQAVDPGRALATSPLNLRPRSLRIIISDFLFESPPEIVLSRLCDGAAYVAVIQLLAESEAVPPTPGSYRLLDTESGDMQDVLIDAAGCKSYAEALANLRQLWSVACRRVGAHWVELTDTEFLTEGRIPLLERAGVLKPE